MHPLTKLIHDDMIPALGVTEPGAIAFAAARARSLTKGPIQSVAVAMNSGLYKNAFTCGIPNSHAVGNVFSAALGVVAGNWEKGLEALADVTEADNADAQALVDQGKIKVTLSGIDSTIFLEATVTTETDTCTVTIRGSHTNIVSIVHNGATVFEKAEDHAAKPGEEPTPLIHTYTLAQLAEYAQTVPVEEIAFIQSAYDVNLALYQEGIDSPRTTFAPCLLRANGGKPVSEDVIATAQLLAAGAVEARVLGLDQPAMSITGSGAHGILATLPLYAAQQVWGLSEECLWRATALSYLVCMYIKEYSGRLSAFCGCAIAAGTGAACGLVLMQGGDPDALARTIRNMASSITGMICDGGNQGCVMKGVTAVDAAFRAATFARSGVAIDPVHGINAPDPETTMRYMGRIASPGMVGTEKTIVEIFEEKMG